MEIHNRSPVEDLKRVNRIVNILFTHAKNGCPHCLDILEQGMYPIPEGEIEP